MKNNRIRLNTPLAWTFVIAGVLAAIVVIVLNTGRVERNAARAGEESSRERSPDSGFAGIFGDDEQALNSHDTQAGRGKTESGSENSSDPLSQETLSAEIDLVAVRKALPDNLYWKTAAPIADPVEIEARVAAKKARNDLYGKVLSNTASVDEIHAYYANKKRQSEDYVKFLKYVLAKHKDEFSERDLGLFGLGIELHTARAAEVPRELADALQRKAQYDQKKQAWLAQQR